MTDITLHWRAVWPVHLVDGDTLDVVQDDDRRNYAVQRLRLLLIDTPELHDPIEANREKAEEATKFVGQWITKHVRCNTDVLRWPRISPVAIDGYLYIPYFLVFSTHADSFDRWLSKFQCQAGHSLNEDLLDSGLAVIWTKR